jgi:hypothetical protein
MKWNTIKTGQMLGVARHTAKFSKNDTANFPNDLGKS